MTERVFQQEFFCVRWSGADVIIDIWRSTVIGVRENCKFVER